MPTDIYLQYGNVENLGGKWVKEDQTLNYFSGLILQTLLELTSVTHLSCGLGRDDRKDGLTFRNGHGIIWPHKHPARKSVQKCQSWSRGNGGSIDSTCLEVSMFICLKNVQLFNVQHAGASVLSTTSMVTVTS